MRKKIGDYAIEWPLSEKFAEWTEEETNAIISLERDKGEYGGLTVERNWRDQNPIINVHEPYLQATPYNLFYVKTKVGSVTVRLYDVSTEGGWDGFRYTSPCHWTQNITLRTLKVNNGESDGYVMFCELENDEGDNDEVIFMLSTFEEVISIIKNSSKNIQEEWFSKIEKLVE